jgi:hypothetical protein
MRWRFAPIASYLRADVGAGKDALDRADVDTLFEEESRASVPAVVKTHLPNASAGEHLTPVRPIRLGSVGRPFGWQNTSSPSVSAQATTSADTTGRSAGTRA